MMHKHAFDAVDRTLRKHAFDAVDRTLRDILNVSNPGAGAKLFGGITVAFGGKFRQILPVIRKGSREDIVSVSITKSLIWKNCKVQNLTENMRLQNLTINDDMAQFARWALSIGDGECNSPSDNDDDDDNLVEIPSDLRIDTYNDETLPLMNSVYENIDKNYKDPSYLRDRAILTPLNDYVDKINAVVLSMIPMKGQTYLSADTMVEADSNESNQGILYTTEFLNTLNVSGLPNHRLDLKIGTPIMLLRNLN
ncbi:hypothetical protein AAC387_Pa05g1926 [Persea americana]